MSTSARARPALPARRIFLVRRTAEAGGSPLLDRAAGLLAAQR